MEKRRVLLGVSGGVASYKAAELAGILEGSGVCTDVLMTEDARRYISPLTFEEIVSGTVYTDSFPGTEAYAAVAVVPATADFIKGLSNGEASDLLTNAVLLTVGQVIIAPAVSYGDYMTPDMTECIKRLKNAGLVFAEPLARRENETLSGSLAPVRQIADTVRMFAKEKTLAGKSFGIINKNGAESACIALAGEARDRGADVSVSGVNLQLPLGVKRKEERECDFIICVTKDGDLRLNDGEIALVCSGNERKLILPGGESFDAPKGAGQLLDRIVEIKE